MFLGKSVDIPKKFYTFLRKLNPDYILARYPDASYGVPYELYDKELAAEKVEIAKEVIKWIEK